MVCLSKNPYAIYVNCDAAMEYDSKNTGGVGFEITFPDSIEMPNIRRSIGKYEGANIERLELEAIFQGMQEIIDIFKNNRELSTCINRVIFITDRFSLNDQEKTSPYRISEWRKNKWHNFEGKPIKNSDQLDKIDKARKKIIDQYHCSVSINYERRKRNKTADKLAKAGKNEIQVKKGIARHGLKISRRLYDGEEINYKSIKDGQELSIHVYKKEPVGGQWEIMAEICSKNHEGRKIKIYCDDFLESELHRGHQYRVKIQKVFSHHISINNEFEDI